MAERQEVVIRRNEREHRWMIQTLAGELITPWSDDAPAVSVEMWIKGQYDNPPKVKVIV